MGDRTLIDEIITLIHSESNNNPPPKLCKIVKTYEDNYCDVEVENLGILIYKKTIGTPKIGSDGIICFLNGDLDQGIVITSNDVDLSQIYDYLINLDNNKSDIYHSHGNLNNDGTISSYRSTSNYFVGLDSNNHLYRTNKLYSSKIINSASLSNLGTSSGALQSTINDAINTKIASKADIFHSHSSDEITDLIDKIYPVGSIYMSVNNVDPSVLFGGSWEQIKDTFLLSSGNNYALGSTGGEANHTLTINEMPSHTHTQNPHKHTQAQHRHKEANKYSNGSGSASAYVYSSNRTAVDHYTDYQTPAINNATATNQNTGGSQAHNNMPPYLVVNIWKRIE